MNRSPEAAELAETTAPFSINAVRDSFPALNRRDNFTFFDNAAGAQVPHTVVDALNRHLLENNVQRAGRYGKSVAVDAMIARARESTALLVNAQHASEIVFGMNATSFIPSLSLAIGQTLSRRNEIIVSDMDHEANIATWLALARDGANFVWWKMRDDGNWLDPARGAIRASLVHYNTAEEIRRFADVLSDSKRDA
jgi:selenocysteine lyase/cysteine desulfurase